MPRKDKDQKWAVAVSRQRKGQLRWRLVKLVANGQFTFADNDDKPVNVSVQDYSISDPEWWSFLVEENVNRNIEIVKDENSR
jgi:hypothetical protein